MSHNPPGHKWPISCSRYSITASSLWVNRKERSISNYHSFHGAFAMPSHKRRQTTLACSRCYSLKKKCDKKFPSCSRCAVAGKECIGLDRMSQNEVPRSVLQYLENLLVELELGRGNTPWSDGLVGKTHNKLSDLNGVLENERGYARAVHLVGNPVVSASTTSCVRSHLGLHNEAKLFYPSERPPLKVPVDGVYHEDPRQRASSGSDFHFNGIDALRIPFGVARHIFGNYIGKILPRYPCFTDEELWYHFGQVYSRQFTNDTPTPNINRFIVSMILAISCLTSKRQDYTRVISLSESLQRDAMRHWTFLKEADMRSLQCLLLLIQLGLMLPYTANMWYMSGEAVRIAIGLGLHQDIDMVQDMYPGEINLRRKLFWTVYLLERTIVISSGCPLAISDEHITTRLPSEADDDSHTAENAQLSREQKLKENFFLLRVQWCQLQSEIYGVQFFDQTISDKLTSYDDWVRHMEDSIQRLLERSRSSNGSLPEWITNTAYYSQHLLHRPCARNMVPSQSSLITATTSAINMINTYCSICQTSSLYLTFQIANNTFQAGVVLLYVLGNHGFIIQEAALQDSLRAALHNLIQLQSWQRDGQR
ncbi:fungal-specific transcription factor domain-containing protein [Xylariales sp. PMI_506]|nr:fungal-specific transcription factor domain-containing protein [Xylariales sp. PMI_506]